eukprot:Protomagalhaensia_wolfi_Nauph_80__295@NODE_1164_length_1687_cov_327_641990_g888_i0_p2_GENE_NODE_1164_length_1687_cov_327_641990_g888_i0NODE_1164_length_1687_cov_327_641990_g888_i0_p2_ORF_typecomplete_len181_score30_35SEO_N/PF14576_6/0_13_NODE_1164_length_1687_cov_327_641990_g888_i010051547
MEPVAADGMPPLMDMLDAEIDNISSKKFSADQSCNFATFQRELTSCVFSDMVIEISNPDTDEEDDLNDGPLNASEENNSSVQILDSHARDDDDEERRQILQFVNAHLKDFTNHFEKVILDSKPRIPPNPVEKETAEAVARSIETRVTNTLPQMAMPPTKASNLDKLSTIIQHEVRGVGDL